MIVPNTVVIYDACVLYPAPLRDLLLELGVYAQNNLWFQAKWTDHVHEEWMKNLLSNRADLTHAALDRIREFMNDAIDDCLVTDYENLIDEVQLPDVDDRHVLASRYARSSNDYSDS